MLSLDLLKTVESIAKIVESIVTTGAIVLGGAWAFVTLVLRREFSRRVEFSVDIAFVGLHRDQWLAEIIGYMENKGHVRHKVTDLTFWVRYIRVGDPAQYGDERINYQIEFPHMVGEIEGRPRSFVVPRARYTFVEPGIRQRYSHVVAIPCEEVRAGAW